MTDAKVLAVILGGGRGQRLYPLTKQRAKPALPLAGKYRLIDIPVSNCINSGITRIYVLTQFNSASLNQHIANAYRFNPFMRGFVDVLAAQQTPESPDWFQGTADAVRKTLWVMERWKADNFLILAGDHLYRMDYRQFIDHHIATGADVTISVAPMGEAQASSFGLMNIDASGRVVDFKEKPTGAALSSMKVDVGPLGFDRALADRCPYLASMGIYVFKRSALYTMLEKSRQDTDFGKHIIPAAIRESNVHAFVFKGYWEDIGTIEGFYHANLALTDQPSPAFSFFDEDFPVYTRARFLPPSKILDSDIQSSILSEGCIVRSSTVTRSVIGIRSRLEEKSVLKNTLLMGADFYQSESERQSDLQKGIPPVGVGEGATIRNAIIDKNARIGRNVCIENRNNTQNTEREPEGYWIRSGIVIVIKGSIIPDNTVI